MSLVGLLIVILIFGLIFWALSILPIPQPFKTVVYIIIAVILILWLCSMLGLLTTGPVIRIR